MSPPENTNLWSYIIRLFFPSTLSFSECDWNIWVHRLRRRFIKKKKFRLFVAEEPQTSTVGLKKKQHGGEKTVFLPFCILNMILSFPFCPSNLTPVCLLSPSILLLSLTNLGKPFFIRAQVTLIQAWKVSMNIWYLQLHQVFEVPELGH